MDLSAIRSLYPFQSNYLDVGGVRMHYLDEGPRDAPIVVMLHGNPTWSFFYRALVFAMRDRYRLIVPDHIGCGLSDKPPAYSYTLATHIDNVERLLDLVGAGEVTLALHDWGGAIGMGWASRHTGRARRFVIFNTAAFFFRPTPMRIRICQVPIVGDFLVRGLNGFARAALRMAVAKPERMTREVRRAYLAPYDNWVDRVAILRFVRDIPRHPGVPSHAVLASIEASLPKFVDRPMIIFWGAKDFCFNDRVLAGWIRRFPGARFHRFEDAGHYVIEDAHERITPLLRDFLEESSGA
jgi:haloalkane dehalogenase